MNRGRAAISLGWALSAWGGMAFPEPPSPQDPKLTAMNGAAAGRRSRLRPWQPAVRGQSLPADSELRCEGVCSVRTADGSTVVLDAGSQAAVGQLTFIALDDHGQAALGRVFELQEGALSVSVAVDGKRPRTVVIGKPAKAKSAARPGLIRVKVGGGTGVSCLQGGARVKLRAQAVDLQAGEALGIEAGAPLSTPHPLASPPTWSAARGRPEEPRHVAVSLGGNVAA